MGYNLDLYRLKKENINAEYLFDWLPKTQAYDYGNATFDKVVKTEDGEVHYSKVAYLLPDDEDHLLLEIPVTRHTFRMVELMSPFHGGDRILFDYDRSLFPAIYFEVDVWVYTKPHFAELLDFLIPQVAKETEEDLVHELGILKEIQAGLADPDDFYYLFWYF